MKKNNILELCLSPDLGGLELYMVRASHYLHDKTNCISVINEAGKLEQYYENTNYKYEKIKRNSTPLSYFLAKKLAKIIDDNKIEVVHLHWTKDIPLAVLAKLLSKSKPKLVQTRNMTMTRFKDDFYHRFLYKNIDMMLPVTYQVKEQLEKFIPQDIRPKIEVLYMGASTPELISKEQYITLREQYSLMNSFVVGIVGRIEEGKGQYLVIDAIKKLSHKNLDVKALVVGHAMDEKYLDGLKRNLKKENLEDKVIFTGFTREAQKLMQICDTLILATDKETFGLVLIEAMACGICVIGSNSGGPLEIIENEKTGLLFESQNSESLACGIEMLMKNPALREKLAKAGKEKCEMMFSDELQFEKLKNILNELV